MANPFRQPYRETGTRKSKFYTILFFGLFIFLFLYLFKPFGVSTIRPVVNQLFITMGFGVITSFVLLVFKFLIEPLVVDEKWTLGKDIIWDVIIASSIGAANYFYIAFLFHIPIFPKYLLYSIWTAILVGSIPVTISHIMVYNKMYRNALQNSEIPAEKLIWEKEVRITAGNDKNDLRFNPKSIVYLCSNDNYVTIVTLKDKIINKVTIRGTLKSAENELRRNKGFVRCHKCYIVNLDFADKIAGHSQNMKIKLLHTDELIPVSRSKAAMLSEKFS
jgi:hypothetical protein